MKLEIPVQYRDGELKEIAFDFSSLTGNDLIAAEEALRAEGKNPRVWEFSSVYLAAVAAKASKLPPEVIQSLNAKDFMRCILEAGNFLAGTASPGLTEGSSGK